MKVCECGHTQDNHRTWTLGDYCAECIMISARATPWHKEPYCDKFKESFESVINTLAQPDSEDPRI